MKKAKEPDQFIPYPTHISVVSGSGNEYTIRIGSCSCRGFSFHHECRHYKEAEEQGLIEKLQRGEFENKEITLCEHARVLRKDAIRQFLKKNDVTFSEETISKIESVLNRNTTPQEVLSMAKH